MIRPSGHRRPWTVADDRYMQQAYPHEPTPAVAAHLGRTVAAVYQRSDHLGLRKTAAYLASPAAGRTNGRQGIGTRFAPGQVPANKGLRRPGWGPGRMKTTQYAAGQMNGRAAELFRPVGATRVIGGYIYRKVSDLPGVCWTKNWTLDHVLVWTQANGPIPAGHALTFVNGDRTDVRLENIALISRVELMRRNTVHRLPTPVKKAIQLLGALKRQIRRREDAAHDR